MSAPYVLETSALSKSFAARPGPVTRTLNRLRGIELPTVHAVNQVSLRIAPGEILGLVGESGCGKSTYGRMVAGLVQPSDGDLLINGKNATGSSMKALARQVQMVFQNPYASLNPRLSIRDSISEAAVYHGLIAPQDQQAKATELLSEVGLDASYANRFAHQFSGGQRQRIAIARALSMQPDLIVCDEAVSALDVSVQAQILNVFLDLREQRELTFLFISHNLSVVEYLADRVAIMYLGRVMEIAPAVELFERPNHPYTQALVADSPRMDQKLANHKPIVGELPSPLKPPTGCAFHPRCSHAMPRCKEQAPPLMEIAPLRWSACHLNTIA